MLWPKVEAGRAMDADVLGTGFYVKNGDTDHLKLTFAAPYFFYQKNRCSVNVLNSLSDQNKYLNSQYEKWLSNNSIPIREIALARQRRSQNVAIYYNKIYCLNHSCENLSDKSTCNFSYTHELELEKEAQGILLTLDSHFSNMSISVKTDVIHKATLLAEHNSYHQYQIYLGYSRVDKLEIIFEMKPSWGSSNGHARIPSQCFKLKKIQPLYNAENIEMKRYFAGKIIPSTTVNSSAMRTSSIMALVSMCAQSDIETEHLNKLSEKYVKEFITQSSLDVPGEKLDMRHSIEKKLISTCVDRNIDMKVCMIYFREKNYKIIDKTIRKQFDEIQTTVLVEFITPEVTRLHNMMRVYPEITPTEHKIGNFVFEQTVLPEYIGNIGNNLFEFDICSRVNALLICRGGHSRTKKVTCFRNLVANAVFDRNECYTKLIRKEPCFKYIRDNEPVQKCFVGFENNESFKTLPGNTRTHINRSRTFNVSDFVWTIWLTAFSLLMATLISCFVWRYRSQLLKLARFLIHFTFQKVSTFLGIKHSEHNDRRESDVTRSKRTLHL